MNIPQGYTVQYNTKGNETTILNIKDGTPTYEPLDITVKKVWSGDQGKNRPTSVNVTLYNGTEIWERVKLSAANDWTFTWYDPDTYGNWQVVENSIPKGYVPSYKVKDGVVTITNSRSAITVQKLWYDEDGKLITNLYDEDGNLERYNIFSTRMLVRCDADGKLYLYDLVRIKKETSKPHEQ